MRLGDQEIELLFWCRIEYRGKFDQPSQRIQCAAEPCEFPAEKIIRELG